MKEKRHIFLTGFMGAGKTTVGRELSRRLRMNFYDLDIEIERVQKLSITDIFKSCGEESFRQKETEMLLTLSQKASPAVFSTGGGVVLRGQNRDIMDASGKVFYLKANVDTLWNRVKNKAGRPLLDVENPRAKFQELFIKRKDIYELFPQIVFTDDMSISEVADSIVEMLK